MMQPANTPMAQPKDFVTRKSAPSPKVYTTAKKDGWVIISMKDDWRSIFSWTAAP
jgi:hypothetical protein